MQMHGIHFGLQVCKDDANLRLGKIAKNETKVTEMKLGDSLVLRSRNQVTNQELISCFPMSSRHQKQNGVNLVNDRDLASPIAFRAGFSQWDLPSITLCY